MPSLCVSLSLFFSHFRACIGFSRHEGQVEDLVCAYYQCSRAQPLRHTWYVHTSLLFNQQHYLYLKEEILRIGRWCHGHNIPYTCHLTLKFPFFYDNIYY